MAGTVAYNAATFMATFTPTSALAPGTAYTATVTGAAQDAAGNALATNYSWGFTTAASGGTQAGLVLGGAGPLVVLAGSTVTSTGATSLTGDLGVSPGAAVTGFPPGTLTGTKHTGDATSRDGHGRSHDRVQRRGRTHGRPVTVAGNLGGLTLPPGLYKSTSSLAISSGDLTLDAGGTRTRSSSSRWRRR